VIAEIKNLKPAVDHVVVMAHWGIELNTANSETNRIRAAVCRCRRRPGFGSSSARGPAAGGLQRPADFLLAGEFCVRPDFFSAGSARLGRGAVFTKDEIDCYLLPTQNKNFMVSFAVDDAKAAILKDLAARSAASDNFKPRLLKVG